MSGSQPEVPGAASTAGQPAGATESPVPGEAAPDHVAGEGSESAGTPVVASPAAETPPASGSGTPEDAGADPARRHFFRAFSREAIQAAAAIVGTATALQRASANATSQLMALGVQGPPAQAGADPAPAPPQATFRSPYRYTTAELSLLDQTRLPDQLVERVCHTGAEVAGAVRDGIVPGGPVLGPVVAYGLLITAEKSRGATLFVRLATLHGTLNALRASRPSSRHAQLALDRMVRAWDAVGERAEGELIATAMRAEADAIADDAMLQHARLGTAGAAALPHPSGRPLEVLLHGPLGPLAGGAVGTALGVVNAAIAEGVSVHAWVTEGRPTFQGARVTTHELLQADVPHTLVSDTATGVLLQGGRVDVVLVGAERIARNGDVAALVGTYPLAVLAARHGVPVFVCATLATVDPSVDDGTRFEPVERPPSELILVNGQRVPPATSLAYNPAIDVTPAALVSGFLTEAGAFHAPYGQDLAAAAEAASPMLLRPGPGSSAGPTDASPGADAIPPDGRVNGQAPRW